MCHSPTAGRQGGQWRGRRQRQRQQQYCAHAHAPLMALLPEAMSLPSSCGSSTASSQGWVGFRQCLVFKHTPPMRMLMACLAYEKRLPASRGRRSGSARKA